MTPRTAQDASTRYESATLRTHTNTKGSDQAYTTNVSSRAASRSLAGNHRHHHHRERQTNASKRQPQVPRNISRDTHGDRRLCRDSRSLHPSTTAATGSRSPVSSLLAPWGFIANGPLSSEPRGIERLDWGYTRASVSGKVAKGKKAERRVRSEHEDASIEAKWKMMNERARARRRVLEEIEAEERCAQEATSRGGEHGRALVRARARANAKTPLMETSLAEVFEGLKAMWEAGPRSDGTKLVGGWRKWREESRARKTGKKQEHVPVWVREATHSQTRPQPRRARPAAPPLPRGAHPTTLSSQPKPPRPRPAAFSTHSGSKSQPTAIHYTSSYPSHSPTVASSPSVLSVALGASPRVQYDAQQVLLDRSKWRSDIPVLDPAPQPRKPTLPLLPLTLASKNQAPGHEVRAQHVTQRERVSPSASLTLECEVGPSAFPASHQTPYVSDTATRTRRASWQREHREALRHKAQGKPKTWLPASLASIWHNEVRGTATACRGAHTDSSHSRQKLAAAAAKEGCIDSSCSSREKLPIRGLISRPMPLMAPVGGGATANVAVESGGVGGPFAAVSMTPQQVKKNEVRRAERDAIKEAQEGRRVSPHSTSPPPLPLHRPTFTSIPLPPRPAPHCTLPPTLPLPPPPPLLPPSSSVGMKARADALLRRWQAPFKPAYRKRMDSDISFGCAGVKRKGVYDTALSRSVDNFAHKPSRVIPKVPGDTGLVNWI